MEVDTLKGPGGTVGHWEVGGHNLSWEALYEVKVSVAD